MKGINRVFMAGNLVHDPELKHLPDGTPMVNVSIAVNYTSGKEGDKKDRVDYFDVAIFRKTAEVFCQYKKKGDPVLVEGKLHQSRWETQDGQKRQRVGIVAEQVHFLPRPQSCGVPHNVGQAFPDAAPVDEGDIPF